MVQAHRAIELAARQSYGRLIAYLVARTRDLAGAQDALADALLAALEHWPIHGVPNNPDAWLLTAARRKILDRYRHDKVVALHADPIILALEEVGGEAQAATADDSDIPDERLKLMFACAHPAVDEATRAPLILQTVLGIDAARIASAFLVSPAAMTKRLVRAKLRIKEAGVAFRIPEPEQLAERLDDVLVAIYAAFTLGWESDLYGVDRNDQLTLEAIWLARVIVQLLPEEPETKGLLALMLFSQSRTASRRKQDGGYVPISEQNVKLWSLEEMNEAEQLLRDAGGLSQPGRYQLEAATQAVHADRRRTGITNWQAIAQLYEGLVALSPTTGARVAQAAALCEAGAPARALQILDSIDRNKSENYQPYWATRAHVLNAMEERAAAAFAFTRAIGLSEDQAVRHYLIAKQQRTLQ